jgi:hypothetical protein
MFFQPGNWTDFKSLATMVMAKNVSQASIEAEKEKSTFETNGRRCFMFRFCCGYRTWCFILSDPSRRIWPMDRHQESRSKIYKLFSGGDYALRTQVAKFPIMKIYDRLLDATCLWIQMPGRLPCNDVIPENSRPFDLLSWVVLNTPHPFSCIFFHNAANTHNAQVSIIVYVYSISFAEIAEEFCSLAVTRRSCIFDPLRKSLWD